MWKGCAFGGIKGRTQLPDLVADYMDGRLKVDEFITHRQPLAKINTAFQDMKAGDCIRYLRLPHVPVILTNSGPSCVVNMREGKD